jgi:hypothetical protein
VHRSQIRTDLPLNEFKLIRLNHFDSTIGLVFAQWRIKRLMNSENAKEFVSANRKDFALAYLARADDAGTVFRALVFSASLAAIGFVLAHSGATRPHFASLLSFGFAALLTLYSWDLQKRKAIMRFQSLQNGDLDTYLAQDNRRHHSTDRLAAFFLALGVAIELAVFGGLRITVG